MKEFIEYLVKNLVDDPDKVEVQCSQIERGLRVQVRVSQGDMGKVVGRKGMTIKALRTIVLSVCARIGQRVELELVE
jgi:uncharacterized protein